MSRDPAELRVQMEEIYRTESRRVFASLVRLLGDFDLAEEALHEAFAAALEQWTQQGLPTNPRAWLVSAGRFKAIDTLRRRGSLKDSQTVVADRLAEIETLNNTRADQTIEDDRLRLVFACCHPSIDRAIQVPLTLREVCELTTEEIAGAFLTSPATMAQRIVRGKAKIRDAGIPVAIPESDELAERLGSVLAVIYLVFNEGYSATMGDTLTRADLSGEAIRLGRLLVELLPDPEAFGLLALMLLQESRRLTRTSADGDIILLEEQGDPLDSGTLVTSEEEFVLLIRSRLLVADEREISTVIELLEILHGSPSELPLTRGTNRRLGNTGGRGLISDQFQTSSDRKS